MKEHPVSEWRMSSSLLWMGVIAGAITVAIGLVALEEIPTTALYAGVGGGILLLGSLIGLGVRMRRPRRIAALRSSGAATEGRIVGVKEVRRFDVDFSLSSLLDGSSGVSLPKVVAFEVRSGQDEVLASRPTTVPLVLADRYVGLSVPIYGSAASSEQHVDIEALPSFNPTDAITRIVKRR